MLSPSTYPGTRYAYQILCILATLIAIKFNFQQPAMARFGFGRGYGWGGSWTPLGIPSDGNDQPNGQAQTPPGLPSADNSTNLGNITNNKHYHIWVFHRKIG
jgi:hypothetical protein